MNSPKITLQNITNSTLTVEVNGQTQQIQNQLEELKTLLSTQKSQSIQYADKIYNIANINEANFGFVTGKKAFNESLTKQLIEAIKPHSTSAQRFLQNVATTPNWETQARISDKAKEIIAYSFVGVIGIQLSKLMAIGKEDFSEAKQRKYIEKCLTIAKRSLDLICFGMLSKVWDAQKQQPTAFTDTQKDVLRQRLDNAFEPNITEQFRLLKTLQALFTQNENPLTFPMPELETLTADLQEGSEFHQTCQDLQGLNEKLDKGQYDLLDCFEAETLLTKLLMPFNFLVCYRMASIKRIGYQQIRNADPRYLHRYAALGIDSKANIDAEKINYTPETTFTDAVLLYRGDNYHESINLFPFVIDYNALTFEQGSKICFYRCKDMGQDNRLEYLFLEDNSSIYLEWQGILKPDTDFNELMMRDADRKILNLDAVVEQFQEARKALLQENLNTHNH
jgi:hypothetical protein